MNYELAISSGPTTGSGMDESEDALEIDDTEILQILEETLYKVPTATASDLPTSNVTAASSSRPRSQTEEAAPTLSTLYTQLTLSYPFEDCFSVMCLTPVVHRNAAL